MTNRKPREKQGEKELARRRYKKKEKKEGVEERKDKAINLILTNNFHDIRNFSISRHLTITF